MHLLVYLSALYVYVVTLCFIITGRLVLKLNKLAENDRILQKYISDNDYIKNYKKNFLTTLLGRLAPT